MATSSDVCRATHFKPIDFQQRLTCDISKTWTYEWKFLRERFLQVQYRTCVPMNDERKGFWGRDTWYILYMNPKWLQWMYDDVIRNLRMNESNQQFISVWPSTVVPIILHSRINTCGTDSEFGSPKFWNKKVTCEKNVREIKWNFNSRFPNTYGTQP